MSIFTPQSSASKFDTTANTAGQTAPTSKSAPVTSGWGTVVEEEHELFAMIDDCSRNAVGVHAADVKYILQNHLEQTEKIIALLDVYTEQLPSPRRFNGLKSGQRVHLRAVPTPQITGRPLKELAEFHGHLSQSIETLLKQTHRVDESQRGISESAQRHEDMRWMLNSLTIEDDLASDPKTSPALVPEVDGVGPGR